MFNIHLHIVSKLLTTTPCTHRSTDGRSQHSKQLPVSVRAPTSLDYSARILSTQRHFRYWRNRWHQKYTLNQIAWFRRSTDTNAWNTTRRFHRRGNRPSLSGTYWRPIKKMACFLSLLNANRYLSGQSNLAGEVCLLKQYAHDVEDVLCLCTWQDTLGKFWLQTEEK